MHKPLFNWGWLVLTLTMTSSCTATQGEIADTQGLLNECEERYSRLLYLTPVDAFRMPDKVNQVVRDTLSDCDHLVTQISFDGGPGAVLEETNIISFAAMINDVELMEAYKRRGVSIFGRAAGSEGDTALHSAAMFGAVDATKWLLANGVPVNVLSGTDLLTPMMMIVFIGERDRQVAQLLLDAGADVSMRDLYGNTVLSLARQRKDDEFADWLIGNGARK